MLRTFLKNQMDEKQRKKAEEDDQRKYYNQQVAQYQMTHKEYQ
mgnify:FL=1